MTKAYIGLRPQMAVLTRAAGIIFPDFEFSWLIPEFRQNAALETDFLQVSGLQCRTKCRGICPCPTHAGRGS